MTYGKQQNFLEMKEKVYLNIIFILFLYPKDTCVDIDEAINESIKGFKELGFLNYFGEQRFGADMTTPIIGQSLLAGDFKKAVLTMFTPVQASSNDDTSIDRVERAKNVFNLTADPQEALSLMPDYKTRECKVLKALKRYSFTEEGSVKAFLNLPYASRLFYLHSYCSFVWNRAVSRRIQKFGFSVLSGDLVQTNEGEVRVLNCQEIENFSFCDLIFPLPGTLVQYPENETKNIYENILSEDGIQASDFHVRKLSINHIPGSYRNALSFTRDLKYELKKVRGKIDLHISFVLPSSSYATILLRQLLHSQTVLK